MPTPDRRPSLTAATVRGLIHVRGALPTQFREPDGMFHPAAGFLTRAQIRDAERADRYLAELIAWHERQQRRRGRAR